jgi:hypothetical protein
MTAWEYLFLEIVGHNKGLMEAQNMVITTSDGRWRRAQMPTNVIGFVNQLGGEGWEMVNSSGPVTYFPSYELPTPGYSFHAVLKRPLP